MGFLFGGISFNFAVMVHLGWILPFINMAVFLVWVGSVVSIGLLS